MRGTYVGVGVSVAVRICQEQHVNVHGVQQGGQGAVFAIISGNLSNNTEGSDLDILYSKSERKQFHQFE